eukprot:gene19852-22563_t
MFCARKYDLLKLQDGLGIIKIKEEFVSSYIRHESFLKQVKELDDNAYTYEIGSDLVAEPSSPTEFSPKPVVRRLLLQVRHGKEIAATFTFRSNSDNNDTEGTSCAVEAMFSVHEALFVSKWENRQNQWSARSSVRHNIEAVLGVDLAAVRAETPLHTKKRKLGVTAQDSSVACERRPAGDEHHCISCLNPKCDKVFHTECAKNWLYSLPSVKKSFGTMFGKCPYCGDVLEVKDNTARCESLLDSAKIQHCIKYLKFQPQRFLYGKIMNLLPDALKAAISNKDKTLGTQPHAQRIVWCSFYEVYQVYHVYQIQNK